jgi:hypothetical protein
MPTQPGVPDLMLKRGHDLTLSGFQNLTGFLIITYFEDAKLHSTSFMTASLTFLDKYIL